MASPDRRCRPLRKASRVGLGEIAPSVDHMMEERWVLDPAQTGKQAMAELWICSLFRSEPIRKKSPIVQIVVGSGKRGAHGSTSAVDGNLADVSTEAPLLDTERCWHREYTHDDALVQRRRIHNANSLLHSPVCSAHGVQ